MKMISHDSIQQTSSTEDSNRVVIFADILGFAALTEENPLDLRMLQVYGRLPGTLETVEEMIAHQNPLTKTFSRFHMILKWALMTAEMAHPLTAITFSDSVFVATKHFHEASAIAVSLINSMLSSAIPVRIGIAFGSFVALKFRSEISRDSGDHAAQFLGTAVVRAYRTEKCGIKGMRILLHPSVEPLLKDPMHFRQLVFSTSAGKFQSDPLKCSGPECANGSGVTYELNYWDPATTKERKAWQELQQMWAAAPDSAKEHYRATAEAINRMRIARGQPPLNDLRRRTLPRGAHK